jgi:hypothetical protein
MTHSIAFSSITSKSHVDTATKELFFEEPVANALASESIYIQTSGVLI